MLKHGVQMVYQMNNEIINEINIFVKTIKDSKIYKEYDNNNAFAFTKADEKISKIYKSSKNETCNIIPVIIAPKANIYE